MCCKWQHRRHIISFSTIMKTSKKAWHNEAFPNYKSHWHTSIVRHGKLGTWGASSLITNFRKDTYRFKFWTRFALHLVFKVIVIRKGLKFGIYKWNNFDPRLNRASHIIYTTVYTIQSIWTFSPVRRSTWIWNWYTGRNIMCKKKSCPLILFNFKICNYINRIGNVQVCNVHVLFWFFPLGNDYLKNK